MTFSSSGLQRSASMAGTLPTARIVRRRDCTDDLFLLWLEPSVEFHFTPGQYITVGAAGIERPYSIVSAPYEPTIELFIEYVLPEYGGRLTPLLYAQHIGDRLTMRPKAKGRFTRRTGVTNHVMVATVTGIAPYVSMIRQFIHERESCPGSLDKSRFFLLQGASHRDEFVYDVELRRLSARYPELIQFVCSVSRPSADRNAGWTGPTGRINLLIEEYLDRWRLPKADSLIYLCGNPGMIETASSRLLPSGWSVLAERFWRLQPGNSPCRRLRWLAASLPEWSLILASVFRHATALVGLRAANGDRGGIGTPADPRRVYVRAVLGVRVPGESLDVRLCVHRHCARLSRSRLYAGSANRRAATVVSNRYAHRASEPACLRRTAA